MYTSFKKHIDILLTFGKLANIQSLTALLVPANHDYVGYTMIKSVYNWFSNSIANILFDQEVINQKRTPQAHRIVLTHTVITKMDGTFYLACHQNAAPS